MPLSGKLLPCWVTAEEKVWLSKLRSLSSKAFSGPISVRTEAEQTYTKGKQSPAELLNFPDSYGNVCVVYCYRHVCSVGALKPGRLKDHFTWAHARGVNRRLDLGSCSPRTSWST